MAAGVKAAAENGVGKGIAAAFHLPASVDEGVGVLSGGYGIHHDVKVSAGGVFHAHGNVETACRQSVLLIFHRPRSHGDIGQKVV